MRSIFTKAALASLAAVPLAFALPATGAFAATATPRVSAVNPVTCGDPSFLQIWGHYKGVGGGDFYDCFANAGSHDMGGGGVWVTQISTGNNAITYHDCNGDNVDIGKNVDRTFSSSVCMESFIIH